MSGETSHKALGRETTIRQAPSPWSLVPLSPHQDPRPQPLPLPLGSLFRQTAPHSPRVQAIHLGLPAAQSRLKPSLEAISATARKLSACWTRGSLSLFLGGGTRVLLMPHGCSARATPLPGSLRPGVGTAMLPMVGGGNTQTLAGQKPFPRPKGVVVDSPPLRPLRNSPQ